MKESKNYGLSVGYSSILIVFVILVFVSFSTLSYKQAEASLDRVNQSIFVLKNNYDADTQAMEIRYEIDRILANSETIENAKIAMNNSIKNINILDNAIEYTIIINNNAQLNVQLSINEETKQSTILSWVVVTKSEDEYSQKGFDV
ncbi:hypothetical protein [Anaerorhabdus sp.]|uniref:hypothetical protein n=1 Tax=Anaerorhabdus sp. TaxID=1872524 RepID=UPI002FCC1B35